MRQKSLFLQRSVSRQFYGNQRVRHIVLNQIELIGLFFLIWQATIQFIVNLFRNLFEIFVTLFDYQTFYVIITKLFGFGKFEWFWSVEFCSGRAKVTRVPNFQHEFVFE
jgi:hypothetical protein